MLPRISRRHITIAICITCSSCLYVFNAIISVVIGHTTWRGVRTPDTKPSPYTLAGHTTTSERRIHSTAPSSSFIQFLKQFMPLKSLIPLHAQQWPMRQHLQQWPLILKVGHPHWSCRHPPERTTNRRT